MTLASLAFAGITCVRGGRRLFAGLDLRLKPGEAALVTGPNGAGKSSLLRLAAGLLTPSAGTVERIGGIALADDRAALDGDLPLGRALAFWATLDGARDCREPLAALGLSALAHVPVRMLSAGQRKRATIARLIQSPARIWLLDEPANGLDEPSLALLKNVIADHRAKGGIALIASHQALPLSDALNIRLGCAG